MAKILIVDDEPAIRRTLKEILEFEKFTVDEATNGLECMVKLKKDNFDVILMDIKMPQMTGMEALERVQMLAPETPVVMISVAAFALMIGVNIFIHRRRSVSDGYLQS